MFDDFAKIILASLFAIFFMRPKVNLNLLGPFSSLELIVYVTGILFSFFMQANTKQLKFITYFLPAICYVGLIFVFSDHSDIEGIRRIFRTSMDVLLCIMMIELLHSYYQSRIIEIVITVIVVSSLVQAIAMYGEFFNEGIRTFLRVAFVKNQQGLLTERATGFQLFGGDSLSMNQALGAVIALFAYYRSIGIKRVFFLIIAIIIIGSSLFAGRTGLLLFCLAFFSYEIYLFIVRREHIRALIILAIFASSSFLLLPFLIESSLDVSRGYQNPITRALQPFRLYYYNNTIETTSTNRLSEMFFIPDNSTRLIFGNSQYGREGSEKVKTDVGYIRFIFGMGILGLAFSMIPFLMLLLNSLKKIDIELIILLFFGLIGNVKIIYLFSGPYIVTLFMFHLSKLYETKHNVLLGVSSKNME